MSGNFPDNYDPRLPYHGDPESMDAIEEETEENEAEIQIIDE